MIGFSDIRENSQDAKDDYACEQSDRIQKLTTKIQPLTNKWRGLKAERDSLKAERDCYKDERDSLKARLDDLAADWAELKYVKTAAAALLENYSGAKPSAGEVDALAEDITQLLTEKYHISKGII